MHFDINISFKGPLVGDGDIQHNCSRPESYKHFAARFKTSVSQVCLNFLISVCFIVSLCKKIWRCFIVLCFHSLSNSTYMKDCITTATIVEKVLAVFSKFLYCQIWKELYLYCFMRNYIGPVCLGFIMHLTLPSITNIQLK